MPTNDDENAVVLGVPDTPTRGSLTDLAGEHIGTLGPIGWICDDDCPHPMHGTPLLEDE